MKTFPNKIILRPRFQIPLAGSASHIVESFNPTAATPYHTRILDQHVFIRFQKAHTTFWSPQLQLEMIDQEEAGKSTLFGLFGPNPTLWTFFMFVHFVVATLTILFGVWAYSNHALQKAYHLQIGLIVLMACIWIVLYFLGRYGKSKGREQMHELHDFMMEKIKGFTVSP